VAEEYIWMTNELKMSVLKFVWK